MNTSLLIVATLGFKTITAIAGDLAPGLKAEKAILLKIEPYKLPDYESAIAGADYNAGINIHVCYTRKSDSSTTQPQIEEQLSRSFQKAGWESGAPNDPFTVTKYGEVLRLIHFHRGAFSDDGPSKHYPQTPIRYAVHILVSPDAAKIDFYYTKSPWR